MKTPPKMTNTRFLGSVRGYKPSKIKKIFTVTSVNARRYWDFKKNKQSMNPKAPDPRCWGWLGSLKEAQAAVKSNAGDMAECCYYTHIVIEEVASGIPSMMFSDTDKQFWYEWKVDPKDPDRFKGKWVKCKIPVWAGGIVGWGIG